MNDGFCSKALEDRIFTLCQEKSDEMETSFRFKMEIDI